MDRLMDGWMDTQTDRWRVDRWTDRRMDGQMNR